MICGACCVIGCGEELVWICLDRVCVGVRGRFVGEMGLYPVKLASLPVLFLYNKGFSCCMSNRVDRSLNVFSVLDGVSQSLERRLCCVCFACVCCGVGWCGVVWGVWCGVCGVWVWGGCGVGVGWVWGGCGVGVGVGWVWGGCGVGVGWVWGGCGVCVGWV